MPTSTPLATTAHRATAPRRPATARRLVMTALAGLAALGSLAACGSGTADPGTAAPAASVPVGSAAPPTGPPAEPDAVPPTLTVRSSTDLEVFDDPADRAPARVLPGSTEFGSPLALLVVDEGTGAREGWLEVLVPGRPNGATGWVRAADVTHHVVTHSIHVDLAERTLSVFDGDALVLTTPVAIGDADHPTPTGRFSLTDKLDTGDPEGPYGPFALGLSGRSEVLTEFAGGDGQIGIHGTDDPASIGRAASHGCIRVPNDVVAELAGMLALGTPVTIA